MAEAYGSLIGAIGAVVDTLERHGLEYALGGAIAYGAWGEPRATRDIDLNLWVGPAELSRALAVLQEAGVQVDPATAVREAAERGMFVGRIGDYRVDVFVPSVLFYDEARRRRVRIRLVGRETWVLSAEVLAVFKMLFFRPKDIADVGRLLEIQSERFDRAFVRGWLVEMLGADDERISTWDRLVAERGS